MGQISQKLREALGIKPESPHLSTEAEALLNHPLLARFFSEFEERLMDGWKATRLEEYEAREEIKRMHTTLMAFKGHFESFLIAGKIDQAKE